MVSFFEDTEAQHAETSRPTSALTPQHQPGYPLTRNSFISSFFFLLMRFPPVKKKIIALLIKCLSCRKVNVIPAPDKATHGDLALSLGGSEAS